MKIRFLLFTGALLACASAVAEPVAIWRVEKEGVAAGHLVVVDAVSKDRLPELDALWSTSRTLVLPMDLDPAALLPALPAALENPNRRTTSVDPVLYRRALAVLRVHGIGGEQIARLRPWAVGLALNPPPPSTDTLEVALLREAKARKKNVRPLETLAEAISDLDIITARDQERMIRAGLARGDKAPILLEELLKAWRANDGHRLQQLIQATRTQTDRFRTEARETRLAGRLDKLLVEGGVLAAISRADAAPESGLFRRLRERGWTLLPE